MTPPTPTSSSPSTTKKKERVAYSEGRAVGRGLPVVGCAAGHDPASRERTLDTIMASEFGCVADSHSMPVLCQPVAKARPASGRGIGCKQVRGKPDSLTAGK